MTTPVPPPVDEPTATRFDHFLADDLGWPNGFPPIGDALDDDTVPWWRTGWDPAHERETGLTDWLRWRGIALADRPDHAVVILPEDAAHAFYGRFGHLLNVLASVPLAVCVDSGGSHRPPDDVLEHYRTWWTYGARLYGTLTVMTADGVDTVACPQCGATEPLMLTASCHAICPIDGHRWTPTIPAYSWLPHLDPPPPRR
ncbi:hypothetical protein [Amycolatopsis sp. NPDC058986]|uniref:hypothetical protein n=1 Tax=unclassified Amycolatopsis TaxID=2618356 RepID=UPI003671035E